MPVRGSLYVIFLLVLIVHISFMWSRFQLIPKQVRFTPKREAPIRIRVLEDERKRQIVRSEDSDDHTLKDGAYLSDKTRSFDRQTRARKVDKFRPGSKGDTAQSGGSTAPGGKKGMKLSDLAAFSPGTDPFREAAEDYGKKKQGQKTGQRSGEIQAEEAVSSTSDHIEGVPLGDLTQLNTQEFKYFGFYNRIREKLEQFWGASIQEKAQTLASEGRRLATDDQLVTALQITLDEEGRIISITIQGSSGVKELDDAAIESFNDAGPFPNPPRELVRNGTVTLEWGFVVET